MASLETSTSAGKPVAEQLLQVRKCVFSSGGNYTTPPDPPAGKNNASDGLSLAWNTQQLRLLAPGSSELRSVFFTLEWQHVHAIWASVKTVKGKGFVLELSVEAENGSGLDFFRLTAGMDKAGREFFGFLQDEQKVKLKSEKASAWAMSRWAAGLYNAGVPARALRRTVSGSSLILEVLFALCFFTQLERLFFSKEEKVLSALSELAGNFGDLFSGIWDQASTLVSDPDPAVLLSLGLNLPLAVMTMFFHVVRSSSDWILLFVIGQHIVVFAFSIRQLVSVFTTAFRSLSVFRRAAGIAHEQLSQKEKSS